VILIIGTSLALLRLRHTDLAPAAVGLLVATAAHGLVDVYWVRGTPVLSWLLVGMASACAYQAHHERA
jgi:ABC-type amino acid transport system permease subunit